MTTSNDCDFFGCNREKKVGATITIVLNGENKELGICEYHQDLLANTPGARYSIGSTFTGDAELRLHPEAPAPPA